VLQLAFLGILTLALAAGTAVLFWMGLAQRRRRRSLARTAHEMGMIFSAEDPFDFTRRYGRFTLASAGHSPRAENVIHGRRRGWPLRALDYHFEAGHGPPRLTRRYGVIVVETDLEVGSALLWPASEGGLFPPAAGVAFRVLPAGADSTSQPAGTGTEAPAGAGERIGPWVVLGGGADARRLARAHEVFAGEPVAVETHEGWVMVFSPAPWKPEQLPRRMDQAVAAVEKLRDGSEADA